MSYEPFKKPATGLVVQKLITQEAAQLQAKFDIFGPPRKQRAPKFPERRPEPIPLMQQTLFPTQVQIAEQQKREAEQRTVEQRKKQWSLWSQETI